MVGVLRLDAGLLGWEKSTTCWSPFARINPASACRWKVHRTTIPREQLRRVIGYLENNRSRMDYAAYRRAGLPTTSAWMESAIKEMNYRIKGTEMFWNNPAGAEAILQIRSAALSDDERLVRFLTGRRGVATLRRPASTTQLAT